MFDIKRYFLSLGLIIIFPIAFASNSTTFSLDSGSCMCMDKSKAPIPNEKCGPAPSVKHTLTANDSLLEQLKPCSGISPAIQYTQYSYKLTVQGELRMALDNYQGEIKSSPACELIGKGQCKFSTGTYNVELTGYTLGGPQFKMNLTFRPSK